MWGGDQHNTKITCPEYIGGRAVEGSEDMKVRYFYR